MSAPRLAAIPFEHLEAELAAFPLASEAGFCLGTTSLDPLISRNDKDHLWRAAERDVLNAIPSFPLDEAVIVRDKLWFHSASSEQLSCDPVPLSKYLRRLAESYIDNSGRPVELTNSVTDASRHGGPESRLRWSWMCRALPPDLLLTARGLPDSDADPFPLNPIVQQMLRDRGFAETHLHLGAALDFSLGWAALMHTLTTNETAHYDFESFGACFGDGRYLGTWLIHAAVVRLLLAQWLFVGQPSTSSTSDFLKVTYGCSARRLDVIESSRLVTLLSELRRGKWFESHQAGLNMSSKEHLGRRFAQTRALYRRLIYAPNLIRDRRTEKHALRTLREPRSRQDVFAKDPLSRIVGWHPTAGSSPETLFVRAALHHIDESKEYDSDFATLFWQVIRIRCLLYRHVVQRPLTPGLQWFVRFFSRIKPLRKNISDALLTNTAARICGKDAGLRSLELRLGTEDGVSACLKKVRQVEEAMFPVDDDLVFRSPRSQYRENKNQSTRVEVGVLFHFSRKRGGGWESGSLNAYGLDHSYPGTVRHSRKPLSDAGNPSGFRFARFYLEQRRHAQALVSIFRKYPRALRTVRGIDLCTDEAGVPIWVMAPLVRWVKEAGQQAASQLRKRGEFTMPPPRLSIHAGEDFVHLLTGLRGLDHAITYLQLEEGDRLGHGFALGVDPSVWCGRVGRVLQTREERLFDLTWEWRCYAEYSEHGIAVTSDRSAYVRAEISRLARSIFGKSYYPEDLMNFLVLLHNERELRIHGFPDRPAQRAHNSSLREDSAADQLLVRYLCDEAVWRQGRTPEIIDLRNLKHEQTALNELQNALRRKVGKLCLTIEVNPSSNLLVGDLGHFVGHPLWRLRPAIQAEGVSPLSVCIGSDDPLTFATTLPHEYQLLFDTLILMGYSHEVAMGWIDTAREAGMQSRFTLTPNLEQISQGLKVPNLLGWQQPQSPP